MSERTIGGEAVLEATVNQVIAERPEALHVFRDYGIDACCGGALTVAEAARRHRVPAGDLLAALAEVAEPAR